MYVRFRPKADIGGEKDRANLSLRPRHHAPAPHRDLLQRLKDKTLEHHADHADADQCAEHDAGIEKFRSIEDDLAEAELRACQQFAADHADPGAAE